MPSEDPTIAKFTRKVVVVTGGASGIGAAVVEAFRQEGANAAILDVARIDGDHVNPSTLRIHCDVSDEAAVDAAFDQVMARWNRVDVVVHSAALLGGSGPFEDLSLERWRRYVDVNLTGSFLVCRAAAKRMIARGTEGRIILVGSVNSYAAERNAAPYVASKGGVRLLTKAAAVDLARHGITVNMIAPGPILTPATADSFSTPATRDVLARVLPGGEPGRPADVAAVALFLGSPESRFVTGTDILVDGGMFAQILN